MSYLLNPPSFEVWKCTIISLIHEQDLMAALFTTSPMHVNLWPSMYTHWGWMDTSWERMDSSFFQQFCVIHVQYMILLCIHICIDSINWSMKYTTKRNASLSGLCWSEAFTVRVCISVCVCECMCACLHYKWVKVMHILCDTHSQTSSSEHVYQWIQTTILVFILVTMVYVQNIHYNMYNIMFET